MLRELVGLGLGTARTSQPITRSSDGTGSNLSNIVALPTVTNKLLSPVGVDGGTHAVERSNSTNRVSVGESTLMPCRAWQAGVCTRGAKCWFAHDVASGSDSSYADVGHPSLGDAFNNPTFDVHKQSPDDRTPCRYWLKDSCVRGDSCRFVHENRDRVPSEGPPAFNPISYDPARRTLQQLVLGSIVTYGAGLDVVSLITGFETCVLYVKNLPFEVEADVLRTLFCDHGVKASCFHVEDITVSREMAEARIVTDIETGSALVSALDGIEYGDNTLTVELSVDNTAGGMSANTKRASDILTISWCAPSARYIAEYVDFPSANAKVKELNGQQFIDRRIKVKINAREGGRRSSSIIISNLPVDVSDDSVRSLSGSSTVTRIGSTNEKSYTPKQVFRKLRADVETIVPGTLKDFTSSLMPNGNSIVYFVAHFLSWDAADLARTRLSRPRYAIQGLQFRLPDPIDYMITIPSAQYSAQKDQWGALLGAIKDKKACMMNINELGSTAKIRLAGSAKDAVGALKVRVESLARGDKVEGWHPSLGHSGNPFLRQIFSQTGAYLHADWKRRALTVYGKPRAVERALELVKAELGRLSSLDHTVTIPPDIFGFFVKHGLAHLRKKFGEENVQFFTSSRTVTVTGGEEARRRLELLTLQSLKGARTQTAGVQDACPICYDSVSSPVSLSCGHLYCQECLTHFLTSAMDASRFPLRCHGDEARCGVPIAIPIILRYVRITQADFSRLLEVAFDAYVSKRPKSFKCCKTPACSQIYRTTRSDESTAAQCPSCFSIICTSCSHEAHEGISCRERKSRKASKQTDAWIAAQRGRVKKCPNCGIGIEKRGGCNHLECRCGAHICWECLGTFAAKDIYQHMRTVHKGIYSQEQRELNERDEADMRLIRQL
ncbi:hypothetical protein F5I97DRAFT_648265 [Phlebopus sp. FC_14]|nr:hypothetical protein F5I97DRAFT_648265 [Phlebopus sp. FC_14]